MESPEDKSSKFDALMRFGRWHLIAVLLFALFCFIGQFFQYHAHGPHPFS